MLRDKPMLRWDHIDGFVRCVKYDVTKSLAVNVVNVVYLAP